MNKRRSLQDKAGIAMEFINTSILLLNCVANTTYLPPRSRTVKTNSCMDTGRSLCDTIADCMTEWSEPGYCITDLRSSRYLQNMRIADILDRINSYLNACIPDVLLR